jgi:hypothetical protein
MTMERILLPGNGQAIILGSMDPQISSPSATPDAPPLFREEQRFHQWWVWVLIIVPTGLSWWPFVQQVIQGQPVGQNPGPDWLIWIVWILIGLGLPVLFGLICLIVEVTGEAVLIRFRPFMRRAIPLSDIAQAEARTYNAVKEYGGWGVKGWSKAKMAYNVSGKRGVELTLTDGRSVMLGSKRADELAAAIQGRLRRPRSAGRGADRG